MLLFLGIGGVCRAAPEASVGAGFLAEVGHDVNPGNTDVRPFGSVFGLLRWSPWSLLGEFNATTEDSHVGNYRVSQVTIAANVWGRYEFLKHLRWSPFIGLGLGSSESRVSSHFGEASDERWANGGPAGGVAAGVHTELVKRWTFEMEARVSKKELDERLVWGLVVRSGYRFLGDY